MLIGLQNQLALEYEIVPASGPAILGHFRVWARGQPIGKFSEVLVLTAVQAQIERSLRFSDRRVDPNLFAADKADAVRILQEALYGEGGDSDISAALCRKYGCFNLTELGISSFDGLYVFLVATSVAQRLLWCKRGDVNIMEAILPACTYEAVALNYLRAFTQKIVKDDVV